MATFNYSIYGFANLDWTIPWVDNLGNRMNNATFDSSGNIPGTFTYYTNPTDMSGVVFDSRYYYGMLDKIYLYSPYGYQRTSNNYTPYINYTTFQMGNSYVDSSNNYVYPNRDNFIINDLVISDNSNNPITIFNFNLSTAIYTTGYDYNLRNDINTSNGCNIPETINYLKSEVDTNSDIIYDFVYELYYGSAISIPLSLQQKFNISTTQSYNIFTNINSLSAPYTTNLDDCPNYFSYNKYFSNNYGNPSNIGWFIINVIGYSKV